MSRLTEVPPVPPFLPNEYAREEWVKVCTFLIENKSLTDTCLGPLSVYCSLHGKISQEFQAGNMPLASMLTNYRQLAAEFKLTPGSKGNKPEKEKSKSKKNRFANNGGN
jgi:phage terminase small subunit